MTEVVPGHSLQLGCIFFFWPVTHSEDDDLSPGGPHVGPRILHAVTGQPGGGGGG